MDGKKRKHVLIIDDDEQIVKGIGDYLEYRGFEVSVAGSGEEGLKQLDRSPPDIVLLDLSMPGMGGFGFLRRISDEHGDLRYPVLVLTARANTESFFDEVPVDGFMAKPCDEKELLRKIEKTLAKRNRRDTPVILLGEDDPAVSGKLVRLLDDAGYDVVCVEWGANVLEKAAVCQPDAIVIKRIMPGMNGDSVAALLRKMSRTESIPVILYEFDENAGLSGGMGMPLHPEGVTKFMSIRNPQRLLDAVKEIIAT